MYRPMRLLVGSLTLVVAACGDGPTTPSDQPVLFRVMTQNLYVGANVDAVLQASPELLPAALMEALGTFAATDWPGRATTIASAIAASEPAVVVLNEVTTLAVAGLAPAFPDLTVDFLPTLLVELEAAGAHYRVAGEVTNIDANLALGGPSIRLVDRDVLLVRDDYSYSQVETGSYAARVTVPLGPAGNIDLVRGWVAATITSRGGSVRVVGTHLEPRSTSPALQEAQAAELMSRFGALGTPVIVAGDLNSDPDEAGSDTPYRQLTDAGFLDGWLVAPGTVALNGDTCCHDPDLANAAPVFDERIDLVMVRRAPGASGGFAARSAEVVGNHASHKGSNGRWASDHAGLVVEFDWRRFF